MSLIGAVRTRLSFVLLLIFVLFIHMSALVVRSGAARAATRVANGSARAHEDLIPGNASLIAGGTLYFVADDGTHGTELWKTDGTDAGTLMVRDIRPGERGSVPHALVDVGGTLFFAADDGPHGDELWKTDGTEAGTILVKDLCEGRWSSQIEFPTVIGGELFFSGRDHPHGRELWKSDGTPTGTVLVKDVVPGKHSSEPVFLADVEGTLFFGTADPLQLWRSDGTTAGTTMVKQFGSGPAGVAGSDFANFGALDGLLLFTADSVKYGLELWRSDGTLFGTRLVKDIRPGYQYSWPSTEDHAEIDGVMYFTANDGTHGRELWRSDGTRTGTLMVKDVFPGAKPSLLPDFRQSDGSLAAFKGILYFAPRDGIHGRELWRSDGTEPGTVLVKDIDRGGSSYAVSLTDVGGTLFFLATDGDHVGLWKSDGSDAGTGMVKAVDAAAVGLTSAGGAAYLVADDGIHGLELWVSDGTEAGTGTVKDIRPGEEGSFPTDLLFIPE